MACFEFCRKDEDNPVVQVLHALGSMMFDLGGEGRLYLALMHGRFGHRSNLWPQALFEHLHPAIIRAFARNEDSFLMQI